MDESERGENEGGREVKSVRDERDFWLAGSRLHAGEWEGT